MAIKNSSEESNYVQVGPAPNTDAYNTGTVWFNNIPYYPSDTDTYTADDTGNWRWVSPPKYVAKGWECPKCGLVWAPWVSNCPLCQKEA